jgi:excisionase family DNA binding protein
MNSWPVEERVRVTDASWEQLTRWGRTFPALHGSPAALRAITGGNLRSSGLSSLAEFLRERVGMPHSVLVEQAAALLGMSRRTVYYRIREGKLSTLRTRCGSQRVLMASVEQLLREMGRDVGGRPVAGQCEAPDSNDLTIGQDAGV